MRKLSRHIAPRLFLLSAAIACLMAVNVFAAQTGIITGDIVNARKGPGTNYERIETLAKGKQVTILGSENGWYHIAWGNDEGYVLCDYVALSGSASADAATSNATVTGGSTINVRSGPGTGYSRVTQVSQGKRVTVLEKSGEWYQVSFSGTTGYIMADYIACDSGTSVASSSAASSSSSPAPQATGNATVTGGSTINVRSGPGTGYSRVAQVSQGKRVTAQEKNGGWYRITFGNTTGYILGDYLNVDSGASVPTAAAETAAPAAEAAPVETAPAEETSTAGEAPLAAVEASAVAASALDVSSLEVLRSGFITGGTINVRSGPGTEYERIAQVYTGKSANVVGEENGWYLISCGDITGYVLGDYFYEGDSLPASSVGEQVAAMAQQYLGVRYVYGGASPSGFDCSGFTMYLYRQFGYSLPHTASGQYANCGYKVSKDQLLPGDLVFFTSSGNGGRINHVGVYIGNGNVIHARMSIGQVYINNLSESYYSRNYVGAIRIAG